MNNDDFSGAIIEHSGWIAAMVLTLGAWLIKVSLHANFQLLLEEHRKLQNDVERLVKEMATVRSIIKERSPNGHYTWPGDKE